MDGNKQTLNTTRALEWFIGQVGGGMDLGSISSPVGQWGWAPSGECALSYLGIRGRLSWEEEGGAPGRGVAREESTICSGTWYCRVGTDLTRV